MTAFFTYERDFARRWCPVVYYGDKPANADGAPAWTIPDNMIDEDGSPRFGALKRAFPAPVDPDEQEQGGNDDERFD